MAVNGHRGPNALARLRVGAVAEKQKGTCKADKRSYSDQEKATVPAVLDANGGNLSLTRGQPKIPGKTLQDWALGRNAHPDVAEIRQ